MNNDLEQLSKEAFARGFGRALLRRLAKARAPMKKMRMEKAPKSFAKAIDTKNSRKAWKGYKEQSGGGPESLLLYPAQWAAEKVFGKDKVRHAIWKGVTGPALKADTAVGDVLSKTPVVGKRLFKVKEKIPWGGKMHREVERSSALGPLMKARDIAAPIIVGVGLEKGMKQISKAVSQKKESSTQDQDLREKVASVMLRLHRENREHEKRAHAERIFWKQVERGMEQPPESYSELQTKLASLVNEDLNVLEKAVELAGGQMKLGELDNSSRDPKQGIGASEKFLADLLD